MNRSDRPRSKTIALVASGLASLLLSGCTVDQKKEVKTYRFVLDGSKPTGFEYQHGDRLSLDAALVLANRNDEQLASSGEDYLQALIDKERQFSAFLPTLTLAPVSSYINHRGSASVNSSGNVAPSSFQKTFTDVPLNSSVNVLNIQDIYNYKRSNFTAEQRRVLLLDLQQTTLLNVAQAYYSVLTNERSVIVLTNSAYVQNERVRDQEGRMLAGVARPLDVAQSEAQAAATRALLIQAQNNVRTSRIALAFLTGAPVQDAPLDDRLPVPDVLAPQDDMVKSAEVTRQDVKAAESGIEAARQNVQAAIAQYYPSASLNIQYLLHKESTSTLWSGVLTTNIPIFIGVIDANVRTAYSQLRQAWLNELRVRRLVSEQVRTAYENLQGSRLRIVELRTQVRAASDALQQATATNLAGLATNLDVLTAQDLLLQAQLNLTTERLNFKLSYIQLIRAQGGLVRSDNPLVTNEPAPLAYGDELTTPNGNTSPQTNPSTNPSTRPATQPATQPTTQPSTQPVRPASNP